MAAGSLLTLLDDIASILDDVSLMTKVAAKKTAGVLGDDLALNAQQVSGVDADRELPVVWSVAKGSLVNKLILVPVALGLSAVAPWAVMPLLMLGGAYLCFEGVEKLAHKWLHPEDHDAERLSASSPPADPLVVERAKIRGAIRTDFILSAEIVIIALGTVAEEPFVTRLAVLAGVGLLMTVGVYGLVGGIVKLDDLGLQLQQSASGALKGLGQGILAFAPWLMKALSVVGTLAMFLVGGGIVVHNVPALHHVAESWHAAGGGGAPGSVLEQVFNLLAGLVVGAAVLAVVEGTKRAIRKPGSKPA